MILFKQVRVIFRLVEFGGGASQSNPILTNEAYQLALDALPMLIALFAMNVVHPGVVLKGSESSFPGGWRRRKAGKTDEFPPPESSGSFELGHRNGA